MQPFRGPPPPRGFPGAMPPPIAGMGGPPPHMHPPPMVVAGGGVMRPMMAPPRGGPMMFAPPSMGPPQAMTLPPPGMGPGPRDPMLFGAHGVVATGPPGVGISNVPPPPGTVDIPVPFAELPDSGPMNVFVGKLPPDLHDNYIRQLLEKCGTVVTWKRTTDPVTGKPKGFGYCTFATANDVLRALRLLNGFAVDTREILLKVDSKTQTKLDVVTKAMTEKMKLEEQERDNEIKQSLKNLCQIRSGRLGGQQNDVATWGNLLEKKTAADEQDPQQQNGVQGVGSGSDGAAGEQDKPDSGDQNGETRSSSSDAPVEGQVRGTMIMREVEKFRLAQEQREQEQEQKRREAILERLRREKEDEEKRRAAGERRKAADERRRAAEEKRKAGEEAARIAKAEAAAARKKDRENRGDDNGEYNSETDEREDGGRRKSSSSRRRDREDRDRDRKKRSTRERSRDHDRKRGRDHRSRSRSKSRERSSRRRRHRKSRSRSRSRTRSRSRSRSRHRGDRERDRESRRKRRHRRDSSADRYRSDDDEERTRSSKRKRDSTKAKAVDGGDEGATERDDRHDDEAGSSPSVAENAPSQSPSQSEIPAAVEAPKPVVMPKVVLGLKMTSATAKKEKQVTIPAVSAFVVEEEVEAKPLRELVPIDYTEEEKLAGASVQQRVAATVARINSRSGNKLVQEKMEPWVKKKIVEYLGEDEPTLMEFLLKKLDQRAQPQEILNELQLVLDDDAEVFVKLLWRKLAFEAVHVSSQ